MIKCPNFELCENFTEGAHVCLDCDVNHSGSKILNFQDNIKCCVCGEMKRGVLMSCSSHYTCVECFKEICKDVEGFQEPRFPYPSLEEKWCHEDTDPEERSKMMAIKPAIRMWLDAVELLRQMSAAIQEEKEMMRKCPICKKS